MSEHSNTATDSSPASDGGDAGDDAQQATSAASHDAPAERPPSADRSGPDNSLRNFGIALFVASAVVVVAAYLLQGGLH